MKAKVIVGAQNIEKKLKDELLLNIRLSMHKRIRKDQITCTVNYEHLAASILSHIQDIQFYLLESVANEVLKLLKTNKQIGSAWVEVRKLSPSTEVGEVSVVCSY